MKASEAKKITLEKRRPFESVLKQIKGSAENGYSHHVDNHLNPDEIGRLIELGYSVKKLENISGFQINDYLISWE